MDNYKCLLSCVAFGTILKSSEPLPCLCRVGKSTLSSSVKIQVTYGTYLLQQLTHIRCQVRFSPFLWMTVIIYPEGRDKVLGLLIWTPGFFLCSSLEERVSSLFSGVFIWLTDISSRIFFFQMIIYKEVQYIENSGRGGNPGSSRDSTCSFSSAFELHHQIPSDPPRTGGLAPDRWIMSGSLAEGKTMWQRAETFRSLS